MHSYNNIIPHSTSSSAKGCATLVDLLRNRAAQQTNRLAYTFLVDGENEGGSLTYAQLDQQARAIASMLQATGAEGERVLLLHNAGLQYIVAFLGCLYAGAIPVPAYPPRFNRSLSRIQTIMKDAQTAAVLTSRSVLSKADALLGEAPELRNVPWLVSDDIDDSLSDLWREPRIDGDTIALLQYTSGSTSIPKGVMVSHLNLLHNEHLIQTAFQQSEESIIVGWLPLYHDMGLIGTFLQPLFLGARCILMPPMAFLQRPLRWLQAISNYKATTSGGPNFAYEMCVNKISPDERLQLDLSSWSVGFNGAEPIRADTLERFASAFESCGFRPDAFRTCYGLAEATLIVSGGGDSGPPVIKRLDQTALEHNRIVEASEECRNVRSLVSSGEPLRDQKVLIVNPETHIGCGPGEVGEIWVSGPSVAQGYWNRPEETQRVFRARLADGSPDNFLRTGDLGFLQDGSLFVTGRIKDLIIIRGLNHYPHDIELTVERCHAGLRAGCGVAFSVDAAGEEQLVVVQEIERRYYRDAKTIVQLIHEAIVNEHELSPHAVVLVKPATIEKTSSGKIERYKCRSDFLEGRLSEVYKWIADQSSQNQDRASDTTDLLQGAENIEAWLTIKLAARLCVGQSDIDVNQPITSYGIDSLCAVELMHGIETATGLALPIESFFEQASISDIAARVRSQLAEGPTVAAAVLEAPDEHLNAHPLSFGQQALWFLHKLEPHSPAYNIASALRIRGELDVDAFCRALQVLVNRHQSLRTVFAESGRGPAQYVLDHSDICFIQEDASSWSDELLSRRMVEQAQLPFDLEEGPLMRTSLFTKSRREHVLLVVIHHIITDFWSLAILLRELELAYEAEKSGRPVMLPPTQLQYTDYVRWQAQMLSGPRREKLWRYWQEQLADELPVLDLATKRPRPPIQSYRGGSHRFKLDAKLTDKLKALSRAKGATLYMTLLAGFQSLLHRYTGQDTILVGSPVSGRSSAKLSGITGYFVNPLVLRGDFSERQPFDEFLDKTRGTVLNAFKHQDYPFALLTERIQPARDLSRSPLFQVMFILQNMQLPEAEGLASFALGEPGARRNLGDISLEPLPLEQSVAQFDLTLMMAEVDGQLAGTLEYNTDLFDSTTPSRMAGHFRRLLESIVANPHRHTSELTMLPEAERQQALIEWNNTSADWPSDECIYDLFEKQAESTPAAVALIHRRDRITYDELNRRANQLSHYLRTAGIGPETSVAICMHRCPDLIVALLAVLKAGGAYVPLDPAYPRERLTFILEDANAKMLLTLEELADGLSHSAARVICVDSESETIARESDRNLVSRATSENLAYIIYTSGSTGKPKGVAITHSNAVAFLHWSRNNFTQEQLAGVLASTSICFDLSIFEIFAPLVCGGAAILADDALGLVDLPAAQQVTLINTVPSAMAELVRLNAIPHQARTINLAGEPLENGLVNQIYQQKTVEQVYNLYGPSEDTTYSTFALIERGTRGIPPIGRPISNTRAYLLDASFNPVPIGVPGKLYLGGAGLARGYLNHPELTAEKFIPDPFSSEPGMRIYDTGDLARRLPDGGIEFLGRIDHQVKVRGFRIELGEITAVLCQHPAVREAVAVAREGREGNKRLIAYVALNSEGGCPVSELRNYLKRQLPQFMVPSSIVVLESLPLTPNGKIDRKALPEPDEVRPDRNQALVLRRTPTEEIIAGIWALVLDLREVSIDQNFFELGGHSLLATRVISRLREAFQIEIDLRALFERPTVASLAEAVEAAISESRFLQLPPIKPVSRDGHLPLSFAQQRLWFLNQLDPANASYNIHATLRLSGPVDIVTLEQSLNEIVRRHEALRTSFSIVDGQPSQVVSPSARLKLAPVDLRSLTEGDRENRVLELSREQSLLPFDLKESPLLRVGLLRLAEEDYVLLLTMHHIISDGWSLGVLFSEMAALYKALSEAAPSPLPELRNQYADFAHWQRQWLDGEVLQEQVSYWRQQLAGMPPLLTLPTDKPRPPVQSFNGARQSIPVSEPLTESLKALCRDEGATLFMALLASFQALLHRYTGQSDIAVGTPIANRNRIEIEPLVGFFANTLVLRTDLSSNPAFRQLLGRVRAMTLGAYANQDLPFEKLVEVLQPERSLGFQPLFQVMLVQNTPMPDLEFSGLRLTPMDFYSGAAKFDLTLWVEEQEGGLKVSLEYSTDLFEAATITRMLAHLQNLLAGAVEDPELRLSDLPLLGKAEQHRLLVELNNTARDFQKDQRVHRLFEQQVERTPDAAAVIFEGGKLTYEELNQRANRLAHYLQAQGASPEAFVGIFARRSPEMLVALLGILKAGAAYLPLDPTYPKEYLALMLEDAKAQFVLTQPALSDHLPDSRAKIICLGADAIARASRQNISSAPAPDNLAYLMYTSGSTGRPKGVMINHRGLTNYLNWCAEAYAVADGGGALVHSPIAFDLTITGLLSPLVAGKSVVLTPEDDKETLADAMRRESNMSLIKITPAHLEMLSNLLPAEEAAGRTNAFVIGGEALRAEGLDFWIKHAPSTRLINEYGPTETVVGCCVYEIERGKRLSGSVPIGRPIANTRLYILDRYLRPVPAGVTGELYIAGEGLARGYLNQPDFSAARFLPDPFGPEAGARMYKTGDLARYLPDGNIDFLGRNDSQVKIRGYRIEPSEIEEVLCRHAGVREAAVVVQKRTAGDNRLTAYAVLDQASGADVDELRSYLRERLPEFKLPLSVALLAAMPLTPNGKLDRRALLDLDPATTQQESALLAPRTETEKRLAELWSEVLGIERLGIDENFFTLGGHSLLATRLIGQIREAFAVDVPLRRLFETPTIEGLAVTIQELLIQRIEALSDDEAASFFEANILSQ
jgi:amino acid adenylation domain-containing protein